MFLLQKPERCSIEECEDEQIGPEQGLFLLRGDAQELPFRDQQIDYVARCEHM